MLHESDRPLTAEDKKNIATNLAKAIKKLHRVSHASAHTHLTSKNVLLDPTDLQVYIGDYGMKNLKSACKYENKTQWTAVEMWNQTKKQYNDCPEVDVFSYGMILWELETG